MQELVYNVRPDTFLRQLYQQQVYICERPDNNSCSILEAVEICAGVYRVTKHLIRMSTEEIDRRLEEIMGSE